MNSTSWTPKLTPTDWKELSSKLKIPVDQIKPRLSSQTGVNSFTVVQLKDIIKYLRNRLFDSSLNTYPQFLSITGPCAGRKPILVDAVCRGVVWKNGEDSSARGAPTYSSQQQYVAQLYGNGASALPNGLAGTNGYNSNNNGFAYASNTWQYQQMIDHQKQLTRLSQVPAFNKNRSPFYHVEKRLGVIPILPRRRITFRITLSDNDLHQIKNGVDGQKRALHLRLFSQEHKHEEWSSSECDVTINNACKEIDKRAKKTGVKKRGFHIVSPLDISRDAARMMDFEISSNATFHGIAVVELVRCFSQQEIANRVVRRSGLSHDVLGSLKQCAICKKTKDLLRCSRCKCVWYCGSKHQEKDWSYHQTICEPPTTRPSLKSVQFETTDDEVECGETRVSLRCPLTICRIDQPVRGVDCDHPQCVDLSTFLSFSNKTGVWQCPVCTKPLKFEDVVVDEAMLKILRNCDEEVDQVRLYPNGTYKPISLDEIRKEDARTQQVRRKKRKHCEIDDGPSRDPPRVAPRLRQNNHAHASEMTNGFHVNGDTPSDDHVMDVDMGVPVPLNNHSESSNANGVGATLHDAICLDSD